MRCRCLSRRRRFIHSSTVSVYAHQVGPGTPGDRVVDKAANRSTAVERTSSVVIKHGYGPCAAPRLTSRGQPRGQEGPPVMTDRQGGGSERWAHQPAPQQSAPEYVAAVEQPGYPESAPPAYVAPPPAYVAPPPAPPVSVPPVRSAPRPPPDQPAPYPAPKSAPPQAAGWATAGPATYGGPVTYGGSAGHQPPERRPTNTLGWIAVALAVVLLAVAVVQSVLLVKLSDRADRQAAELRASNARQEKLTADLDAVSKRIAGVDDRTKGALNSAAVAQKVLPSVFRVRAGNSTGTAFAFGTPDSGTGTLLVTNYHVVEDAVRSGSRSATLERGAQRHPAQIVKMDERRDIAVLQVSKVFPRLRPASAAVQPGQPVVVVGAPLGLTDTVTTGVVSAVRADVPGLDARVIQFDAAISPGNSGGPVSNADGQVVGVAQAKIVRDDADGLALAIPISEVCDGLVDC